MDINNEIEKIKKVLEVAGFSEEKTEKTIARIGEVLLAKIMVEALERKGYKSESGDFDAGNVEKFLEENYSVDEMQELSKEVGTKFMTEYFANILQGVSDKKLEKVKEIISA